MRLMPSQTTLHKIFNDKLSINFSVSVEKIYNGGLTSENMEFNAKMWLKQLNLFHIPGRDKLPP